MISLIQHFGADFLWKVILKILNSGIILKTFTHVTYQLFVGSTFQVFVSGMFTYWVILQSYLSSAVSKSTFMKNSFRNTIRVSNSLDPDQARHIVGPDLGPNCLQRLLADDT